MSLFELPMARIKRISEEIKAVERRLEQGRLSLDEQRELHRQRTTLVKTLDELEVRTRNMPTMTALR